MQSNRGVSSLCGLAQADQVGRSKPLAVQTCPPFPSRAHALSPNDTIPSKRCKGQSIFGRLEIRLLRSAFPCRPCKSRCRCARPSSKAFVQHLLYNSENRKMTGPRLVQQIPVKTPRCRRRVSRTCLFSWRTHPAHKMHDIRGRIMQPCAADETPHSRCKTRRTV